MKTTGFAGREDTGGSMSVGESPLKRFGCWGLALTLCRLTLAHHGTTIRTISP